MPGLIGLVSRAADPQLDSVFARVTAPMARGGNLRTERLVDARGQWALGRVHLGVLQPEPQLAGSDAVRVLFHGDLHNARELAASTTQRSAPGTTSAAAILRQLYDGSGTELALRLKGAFCAVILDEARQQLVLINDLLGSYPMYWCQGPERFVFSSELRAVLRDPSISPALDPRAVADYIQFGFVFGDRTLAAAVRLLPSASVLTYSWKTGTCELQRYRRVADLFQPRDGVGPDWLERLHSTFDAAVARTQTTNGTPLGLSLSGGLDTRAVLSAVDTTTKPVSTYTLGVKGCADEVIAARLASIAGTNHRFFELDKRYLSGFLPNVTRMVSLTDGMYLSHGLTEMLALQFLADSDFKILLRGHCGEMAKATLAWPFHVDAAVEAMRGTDELIPYLLKRLDYVKHGADGLFTDDWAQAMEGGAERSLAESLDGLSLSPADACSYLYLEEQHRHFTVGSLEIFRNVLEVRLPFADEAFLEELLSLPVSLRSDTAIHRSLIQPRFLRVRNSNTGAPAGAGPRVEFVLDKFNTLFKRLNLYGYRHYHDFDAWMKAELLSSVESVLLDPATLARGMLRESTLRRLIAATRDGTADHGYLFQVLLILELWQRENS